MSQYFDLFNLPATFALDTATLDARYRAVAAHTVDADAAVERLVAQILTALPPTQENPS